MGGLTWLMGRRFAKTHLDGCQAFNRSLLIEAELHTHAK